jgi:hypothetical protein
MEELNMDAACIFILTINSLLPVYAADHATQVDQLSVGDRVCVTRIENGWTTVHWSSGNIGHTGYMQDLTIKQNAQPTEPTSHEEEYDVPPPVPPVPAPQPAPQMQRAPYPRLDQNRMHPATLVMQCFPQGGAPYAVAYTNGSSATFSQSGVHRDYPVIDERDDQRNHVFYVAAKRNDQDRTLYYAFDYSQMNRDVSAIRVKAPNGYDARDKCWMDWGLTK